MSFSAKNLRDGASLFGSRIFVSAFSILITAYIIRMLSKEELAVLSLAGLLGGIVGMIANLGLTSTCIRLVPEWLAAGRDDQAGALLRTVLVVIATLSLGFSMLLFVGAGPVAQIFLKDPDGASLIRWMVPAIFAGALLQVLDLMMQSVQEFGRLSLVRAASSVAQQILTIPAFLLFGLPGVLIVAVTGAMLAASVIYLATLRRLLLASGPHYPLFELLHTSWPFYGFRVVRFLGVEGDQFLVALLLSPVQFATYTVARGLSMLLFTLVDSLFAPVVPLIAAAKADGIQAVEALFTQTSRYVFFITMPVCLGLASSAYPVLALYAGERYLDAVPILVTLSLAMLFYSLYSLYGNQVYVIAPPAEIFKLESVNGASNMLLGLALVGPLGAAGLALGNLLSYALTTWRASVVVKRIMNPSLDIPALKTTLAASLVMSGVMASLLWLNFNLWLVPVYMSLGAISCLTILARALTDADKALLSDLVPVRLRLLMVGLLPLRRG